MKTRTYHGLAAFKDHAYRGEIRAKDVENKHVLRYIMALEHACFVLDRLGVTTAHQVTTDVVCIRRAQIESIKHKIERNESTMTDKKPKIGDWNGIANVAFSRADKDACLKWAAEQDPLDRLDDLLSQDYKITINQDMRSDAATVAISCYNESKGNYKFTMISRGPDAGAALAVALYKHYVISDENWKAEKDKEDIWS